MVTPKTVFSVNEKDQTTEETRINEYFEYMNEEFEKNNTTLEEQLDLFITEDLDGLPEDEKNQIINGIEQLKALFTKDLNAYPSISIDRDNIASPNTILPPIEYNPNLSNLQIASLALGWFKLKNYDFSALLLSRGLNVRSKKEFIPSNDQKRFLYNTVAYNSLKRKDRYPNGSVNNNAVFQNKYNRDEADAYYSIHKFTARMTHNRVIITDIYDFHNGGYDGAASIAVNALAALQREGDFVPFPIRIHLIR